MLLYLSVLAAVAFLILTGFFLEYKLFQIPAGASITLFFAILIGISGAISYFLQSWSVPFFVLFIVVLNFFYQIDWIDPRNKAYGLNYNNKSEWPSYDQRTVDSVNSEANAEKDKQNMIGILDKWKLKQEEEKPLLVLMATSGGGNRSATFTMNVLQAMDSLTNGQIFNKTFLITGASGGMIGATYFRELYRQKVKGKTINLHDEKYVDNIAEDLLNPIFSSFVASDILSPAQIFM